MRKNIIFTYIFVVLMVFFLDTLDIRPFIHGYVDRQKWGIFRKILTDSNIYRVVIYGNEHFELHSSEKSRFLALLKNAGFYECATDNKTASNNGFVIYFGQAEYEFFRSLGTDIYEASYDGRVFLIKCPGLDNFIVDLEKDTTKKIAYLRSGLLAQGG